MNPGLPVFKRNKLVSLETLALVVIAIAVIIRIVNLGSREFWYDEVLSLILVTGNKTGYQVPTDVPVALTQYAQIFNIPHEAGIGGFFSTLKNLILGLLRGEPHPPLFYLGQHLWLRFFGNTEAAMRSLNTLFSIAAITSAYNLGKVFLGHRAGLLLAALLGINPFYLFHSVNVRMYSPLMLWTTLSATALLYLINKNSLVNSNLERFSSSPVSSAQLRSARESAVVAVEQPPISKTEQKRYQLLLWNLIFIGSIAAGLLTFYLYLYWVITLAVVAIYLDRRHWWQHGLRIGAGISLIIPWMLWGGIKQLRSADFKRFSYKSDVTFPLLNHFQDTAQTIASNLVLGDWVTSLPTISIVIVGCVAIALIIASSINLWQKGQHQNLGVALILGFLPLLLAVGLDIATKKFTINFGGGRTMIIILPGCLLLMTLWLEKAASTQWRIPLASGLLILYLTIGISDFSLRHRTVFHSVTELVAQQPNQPTLIAMNSKAWGHVLRLAYYLPTKYPVMLLAEHPANLATSLEKILQNEAEKYPRIIWLDSSNPVWSKLKNPAEIEEQQQKIQQTLSQKFQLQQSKNLTGTMILDSFNAKVYTRSSSN